MTKVAARSHRERRMNIPRIRRVHAAALAASVTAVASSIHAQSADDPSSAASIVRQLENDPAHRPITSAAVERAKKALERATRLRGAGDEAHAKAADGLAREWALTARDLARAADAEGAASDLRHKAVDAQARLERTRALVEEGIARIGRLRSGLASAGHAAPKDRTAVDARDEDRTAGTAAKPDPNKKPEKPATGERR